MCFTTEAVDKIQVITIDSDRMDANMALKFKAQMAELIDDQGQLFLIDLSAVSFIDSSGLGAIAASQRRLGEAGTIALCNGRESLVKLFKLTRMEKMFRHFDSKDAALVFLQTTSTAEA